ncbi:MAG TPA: metal-binding protein [Cyanobacteria bacterium UBA8543]|nr:metal-binding protein [Cyanobacteria bacterium UBA8543]
MSNPNGGRLVWNHSTHIQGLIPVLERLTSYSGIQTITPAVIGRAKSHSPKLQLKVSVPIRGGFKLIARAGKTYQEVFILTNLSQVDLENAIAKALHKC